MKPPANFDFRDLIGTGNFDRVNPQDCERLIIGAASCDIGIALVALKEGELGDAHLDAYAHVVIGPIEDDWEHIAALIDQLRRIFEPPTISHLLLRVEEGEDCGTNKLIFERLSSVFPEEIRLVRGERVANWIKHSPCRIGLPDIPENDVWTRKLLYAAAETAVFLEHGAMSLGRPDLPTARAPYPELAKVDDRSAANRAGASCPAASTEPSACLPEAVSATAVSFTNPMLHIATVRRHCEDGYLLDEDRTYSIEVKDRSAKGIAALQSSLKQQFQDWKLEVVSMRVGADKGPYQLHPNAYKIEAALQLLDGLAFQDFSVAQVSGFAKRFDHLLPAPQSHLKQRSVSEGQRHAIRTAALALHRIEQGG